MTRLILVRHGQTEWNRVERFRGRADVPLNETGLAQAEATGRRLAVGGQAAAIYSSSLSRAVSTAEAIARHSGVSFQVHPGLTDIDYGEWQGLSPDEVRQRWPEMLDAWYHAPQAARIPGGETLDEVRARAMDAVKALTSAHAGDSIILVGHTVINRVILLGALGLDNSRFWRLRQDPCAINVIAWENGEFTMVSLNDTCHLNDIHLMRGDSPP